MNTNHNRKYYNCTVIGNKLVNDDTFILTIEPEQPFNDINPGQFFNIKVNRDLLLRRPFSIFNVNNNKIDFAIKATGQGTEKLKTIEQGELLNILGPLGNSFSIEKENPRILSIAGGTGIVPLYYFQKKYGLNNKLIWGTYSEKDFFLKEEIVSVFEDVSFVSEKPDSKNNVIQGMVTDVLEKYFNINYDYIFVGGPNAMMKTIYNISDKTKNNIIGSFEAVMGCGIGICLSCAIETKDKYKICCKEGPIFRMEEIYG